MSQLFDILIYAVVNSLDMYACFSTHLCVPIYSVSLSASKKISSRIEMFMFYSVEAVL